MRLGLLIIVTFCLAATGCADRQSRVESAIRKTMKDPESARFAEKMQIYGDGESVIACGLVNAKNGFGGYTGEVPFMLWNGTLYVGDGETANAVVNCCRLVYEAGIAGSKAIDQRSAEICSYKGNGLHIGAI